MSVVLSMVLVGGAATLYGPVLAAFLLSFATESMVTLGAWRYIIVSALMILVLRFAPGGIASIAVRLRPPPPPADGGPENARAPAAP
jgi:ABC-type branched-subunit amino acid transport system permease subunit